MCRTGCLTQDHESWGACAKAANLRIGSIAQAEYYKHWDGEMRDYESAVRQGMQPKSTRRADIDEAVRLSNEAGRSV